MNTNQTKLDQITAEAIIKNVKSVHRDNNGDVRVSADYALDLLLRLGVNLWEDEEVTIAPKKNLDDWTKGQVSAVLAEHTSGVLSATHAAVLRANTGIDAWNDANFMIGGN